MTAKPSEPTTTIFATPKSITTSSAKYTDVSTTYYAGQVTATSTTFSLPKNDSLGRNSSTDTGT